MNGGVKGEAGNGMRKEGKNDTKSIEKDNPGYDRINRGGGKPPLFQNV